MIGKTSRGLRPLALLVFALLFLPSTASAVFERVGPVNPANGYPTWYQDKTGLALEFCSPTNQFELDGGFCLILPGPPPAITTAPEVFPTNFSDEHFFYSADAIGDMTLNGANGGKARLVQALEGAFATGPVVPGEQVVFGRLRFDFRDLPFDGTYIVYTPYGVRTFPGQVGGAKTRLFYTEDIGITCPVGDFTCALQATVGPFLLPSLQPGGLELPAFSDAINLPGKLYIADPARIGPVTGSIQGTYPSPAGPVDPNRFRIDVDRGPANGGVVTVMDVVDFSLMGRIYQQPIPSRVTIDRASYARSLNNDIGVDVYATGEPTIAPRLPTAPHSVPEFPLLQFFDAPCVGTPDPIDPLLVGPPWSAPAGVSLPMPNFGTAYYGHSTPAAIPAGVCVVNLNAKNAQGVVVPHYDPATLGDQVFISEAFYDPANGGSLNVYATSSDDLLPPQLSIGAFGLMAANQPLVGGVAIISPLAAPPATVRVLSQEGGANSAQVKIGRRAATGVTVTANLPSPQSPGATVIFTAQGQGSSGYQYRFWLNTAGTWAMVQDWSTTATWPLPTSTVAGQYLVQVEVRTSASVVRDAVSANLPFELKYPPATGVTVSANLLSPQAPGTPVVFTAVGQGSSNYQYRFWLNTAGSWAIVQEYGIGSTWTLPAITPAGSYFVLAEVRTSTAVARDAVSIAVPYTIQNPAATGVVVTSNLTSPQAPGAVVVFTATGQGSTGYQYRFWFNNGTSWSMVQDYGVGSTWSLPLATPPGNYLVLAEVRTNATVARDAISANFPFRIAQPPATGVTVTANLTSPQFTGTAVTFTAAGAGSSSYEYRFWLNNGVSWSIVQPYSATATWTLPANSPAATYTVLAEVRTSPLVAADAVSLQLPFVIRVAPATGITLTPDLTSPQAFGTPVVFTALGQGSSGYDYQFWLNNGTGWVVSQAYGNGATWTLPGTTPAGTYSVLATVRTTTGVPYDVISPTLTYVIQ